MVCNAGARIKALPSEQELDAEIVAVMRAGIVKRISDLVMNRFDGTGKIGIEGIVEANLPIDPGPGTTLSGRSIHRIIRLGIDRI